MVRLTARSAGDIDRGSRGVLCPTGRQERDDSGNVLRRGNFTQRQAASDAVSTPTARSVATQPGAMAYAKISSDAYPLARPLVRARRPTFCRAVREVICVVSAVSGGRGDVDDNASADLAEVLDGRWAQAGRSDEVECEIVPPAVGPEYRVLDRACCPGSGVVDEYVDLAGCLDCRLSEFDGCVRLSEVSLHRWTPLPARLRGGQPRGRSVCSAARRLHDLCAGRVQWLHRFH